MILARGGSNLGMIPSWQFSQDPAVNMHLNPHVKYPEGWSQMTAQPVGPYYAPPRIAQPTLTGLGFTNPFDSWAWTNRKWIVLGGIGLVGAALLAGAGLILK
jgi:hypothetical protein